MAYDATLIAPYGSGLKQYYKPFLIGNDAFTDLENCYSWRGVVKKREGSTILARLPQWNTATAITNVSPPQVTCNAHGLINGDVVWLESVQMQNGTISSVTSGISTIVTCGGAPGVVAGQTVIITGVTGITPEDPLITFNNTVFTVINVAGNNITLNVNTTGSAGAGGNVLLGGIEKQAFVVSGAAANTFNLQLLRSDTPTNAPASGIATSANIFISVEGLKTYITPSGSEQLIAFHSKKVFLFNPGTGAFNDISFTTGPTAISWAGNYDNFFYASNYANALWVTNNVTSTGAVQPVGIRYYSGNSAAGWFDFQPQLDGTPTYLNSALIIIPLKGRLVALNTTEGAQNRSTNTNFQARARWSQRGTPYYGNPVSPFTAPDTNPWRSDIPGRGGFIDADTTEKIVSVEVIQDTAIVNFQFSTWRLRYTGNEILPFIWERINTQYGSEGTFTTVAFDEYSLEISRRGITKSTFNDVDRMDLDIPDYVDNFSSGNLDNSVSVSTTISQGINRICSVRDYQKRLVYWSYPDQGTFAYTPTKILCWNYQDNTWATFLQGFTCFANYKFTSDNTWSTWTTPWETDNNTWNTPLDQFNTLVIVGGTTDSNVWLIMQPDVSTDNGVNYTMSITTNLINPYFKEGHRCKLAFYDLYVTNTDFGQITLENYTDDDPSNPWLIKTVDTNDNAISKNSVKISKYVRVFLGMIARQHQITLTLSPSQLQTASTGSSPFELQGIVFHTKRAGRLKM